MTDLLSPTRAASSDPRPRSTLLSAGDPPVYEFYNPEGRRPLLLICDHASRAIPQSLDNLGLEPWVLEKHVAYDIGAAPLTRILADRLDCPALLAGYSRLLIDCNRQLGDPGSIPEISDNIPVPGNTQLTEAKLVERAELFFWPYHHAITNAIAHQWRRLDTPPALFSVHSFTPRLGNQSRPWDAGVLWNRDPRIAVPMINNLRRHRQLIIGDNEPYSGKDIAYSIDLHAGAAGLPNCAIEIRQNLLADDAGIERWADFMAAALEEVLAIDGLHQVEHF